MNAIPPPSDPPEQPTSEPDSQPDSQLAADPQAAPLFAEIVGPEEAESPSSGGSPTEGGGVDELTAADRLRAASSSLVPPQRTAPPAAWAKPVRSPHPHIGWAILWVIALLLVQGVVTIFAVTLAVSFADELGIRAADFLQLTPQTITFLVPVTTLGTFLAAVAVCIAFYRGRTPQVIGWRGMSLNQWVLTLLLVIPMALIAGEVANWVSRVVPAIHLEGLMSFGEQTWPLVFIAACLLPGLGEEIFFRGFLSRGLVANHGVIGGGLLAAFLFGAVHVEPIQASGAFVLGIGLQFIFLTTRSLIAPIIVHVLNNAMAFALVKHRNDFTVPGVSPTEEPQHTPVLVLAAAVLATVLLCIALYQTRTKWKLPDGKIWSPGFETAEIPSSDLNARPTAGRPGVLVSILGIAAWLGVIFAALHASGSLEAAELVAPLP